MKQASNIQYYLEGNTLITLEGNMRATRCYNTALDAQAAYDALPGEHHQPPWPVETRVDAGKAGKMYYYTGKLCKNNHSGRRYVASGGACVSCHALNQATSQRRARGEADGSIVVRLSVPLCKAAELREYVRAVSEAHGLMVDCEACKGVSDGQ